MYSAYIHIPFCEHRCNYCDFITTAGMKHLIPEYVSSLNKEFRIVGAERNLSLHSIYFGGGTPSLIPLELYSDLIPALHAYFNLVEDCEITIEVNPGTLTYPYLLGLRQLGFNRLSMGVQSMTQFDLVRLERIHNIDDILKSYYFARKAGFNNISMDMIFSLPWQDLKSWENSLSRAITLLPEHFSLYSLIIEPGTLFHQWYQKGLIAQQDQDLEGDMYQLAMELLNNAGYEHYEISNWAKKDIYQSYQSRHNKQYWYNQPYLGFGVGAHGYSADIRTVNVDTIPEYIRRINQANNAEYTFPTSPVTIKQTYVDPQTQMKDFMMLGLRLVGEGLSAKVFKSRYSMTMMNVFEEEINSLIDHGLIEWERGSDPHLHLTKRGIMIANQAFMEFV